MASQIHAGSSPRNVRFRSTLSIDDTSGGASGNFAFPSSWHLSLMFATMNHMDSTNHVPNPKAAAK